jgi:MFS family permease
MNPWRGIGTLPREVWVLCATNLVNRMGMMGLPFLVVYLTERRGFSPTEAGLVLSVYGLCALLTAPFAGRLSDAIGPLRVMKISLFLSAVVLILFPFAESIPMIIGGVVLWSVTGEAYRPASLAIITSTVPSERRRAAFSVNRLAINLGVSIGPAFGGFLLIYSFKLIFWVDGATSFLAVVLLMLAMRNRTIHTLEERSESEQPTTAQRHSIWRDRRLLYFLAVLLPVFVTFFQHNSTLPLIFFQVLHQPPVAYGLLFTVNTLLIVFVEVPLNLAMSHWPHRSVLALGAVLVGIGFGAMIFAVDFWTVAGTVVIWTFGEMILLPGASTYVGDIAPPGKTGIYMGAYQMIANASFALGPWLGMLVFERFGAPVLWVSVFIACLIAAALLLRMAPIGGRQKTSPGASAAATQ